jgi:hypothetical protein
MNERKHAQYMVYPDEAAIPRYQRAWVWGVAALAILLCGIAAGWLFAGASPPSWPGGARSRDAGLVDGAALLARREADNERLRQRIAGLEQALAGDACAPAALKALARDAEE